MTPLLLLIALASATRWKPTEEYCGELRERTQQMFGALPSDASLIESGLWLGNVCAAADEEWLARHNVTCVINMAVEWCALRSTPTVHRSCLALDDSVTLDEAATAHMLQHGADLVAHAHLLEQTVLVHCNMGVSRSAAVVLRYLLDRNPRLTYDDALALVQYARPIARPNALFESLLNSREEQRARWKAKHELK